MPNSNLQIDPLTTAIGAEISGVDLTQRIDEATSDAIYQALLDHLVIFFRDQDIAPEHHPAGNAGDHSAAYQPVSQPYEEFFFGGRNCLS